MLGAGRGGALPSGGEVRCWERGEVALFTLINTDPDKLTVCKRLILEKLNLDWNFHVSSRLDRYSGTK